MRFPAKAFRLDGGFAYVVVAVISLVVFALDYDLAKADPRSPLTYLVGGDAVYFAGAHFKGMADNGWYLDNALLGAPGRLDLRDFPAPDLLYFAVIALGNALTSSWVLVLNAYVVLSFPLTAIAALFVMRRFGIGPIGALSGSLLYAFLPFHHQRLFGHPHLGMTYYVVPFGALLALAILRGEEVYFAQSASSKFLPRLVRSRATLAMAGYAVFVGLTGHVYFTFFAICILAVAGIAAALRARSLLPLWRTGASLSLTLTAFLLQTAPVLAHVRAHGSIPIAQRSPADAEVFALKITQLLLPQTHHRFEGLRRFKQAYDATAPLVNENGTSYLGLVGGVGFVVLVFVLLAQARRTEHTEEEPRSLLPDLAVLNMGALLLGTMGGAGAIIAFAGFPEIRSYNRISVCVGFSALFAIAVLVDRLARRAKTHRARTFVAAGAFALTTFGIYETSFAGAPDHAGQRARWAQDAAFVGAIEEALPPGAMVFQLPHMSFPEAGRQHKLPDYGPMVPYLHGKRLRWSYGAMRGRRVDDWNAATAELPVESMAEVLALAGFDAVYVSRPGFADGAAAIEADLERVLGPPIVVAKNGIASVFSLRAFTEALRGTMTEDAWLARSEAAARPMYLGFYDGFRPVDKRPDSHRAASGRRGRFLIENPSSQARRVTFHAKARTAKGSGNLRIRGPLFDGDFALVANAQVDVSRTFDVPPGEHWMTAECDGATSDQVWDGRRIVFVFDEPELREP